MYKICVTNRKLALEHGLGQEIEHGFESASGAERKEHIFDSDENSRYLCQIERALQRKPDALILREKDLSEQEYETFAKSAMALCEQYHVTCILNSFVNVAMRLKAEGIQLSFQRFISLTEEERKGLKKVGVSVHSVEEATFAEKQGADYLVAGHIFLTDCKKGVPARGLEFLRNVCRAVKIPVYAIGGIHEDNASECMEAGAAGVCMMSEYMCN